MSNLKVWCVGTALLALPGTIHSQSGCLPPPAGLLAWWRAEGNALDSAGPNNATLVGGVGFTNGMAGQGFLISGGGNDYVALPQNVFPFPSTGTGNLPITFEVWFRTSREGVILGQQDHAPFTGMNGWVPALYVGTSGLIYGHLFEGAGSPPWISNSVPVNDGRFHHTAVTYDGTNEFLFVDGALVASMPFTQKGYGSGNYQYQLGTGYTAGWPDTTGGWMPFAGVIDEASLYDRALAPGEIAAIYNAGSAGKCTAAEVSTPVLLHRYSFNETAGGKVVADAIGGANGVLEFASATAPYTNGPSDGSGFNGNGQLTLTGTNGFVALPPNLVSKLMNLTLEAWVTWGGPATVAWQRILDFGSDDNGTNASGTGTNYLLLTPSDAANKLSFEATIHSGGQNDPNALTLDSSSAFPMGKETYIAVTYDPVGGSSQLFINGALVNSFTGPLDALSSFVDYNDWLGRSQWSQDPFFNGQYDEFRVWSGLLTQAQITDHFASGPNEQFGTQTQPWLSIIPSHGQVILSWPTNAAAGFALESSPSLTPGGWLAVTNGVGISNATYTVTFPAPKTPAFYRLRR